MKGTINQQTLVGHVGEVYPRGKMVEFTVATNYGAGNPQAVQTEWHTVKVLREKAVAYVKEHVKRGQLVFVRGETRTEEYKDAAEQLKKVKKVYSEQIEILNWGLKAEASEGKGASSRSRRP